MQNEKQEMIKNIVNETFQILQERHEKDPNNNKDPSEMDIAEFLGKTFDLAADKEAKEYREALKENQEIANKAFRELEEMIGYSISWDFFLGWIFAQITTRKNELIRELQRLKSNDFNDPINAYIDKQCKWLDLEIDHYSFGTLEMRSIAFDIFRHLQAIQAVQANEKLNKSKDLMKSYVARELFKDGETVTLSTIIDSEVEFWARLFDEYRRSKE